MATWRKFQPHSASFSHAAATWRKLAPGLFSDQKSEEWPSLLGAYLPEPLEVYDEDVGQRPEGDLLGGVVLLLLAVGAEPGVLAVQLGGGQWDRHTSILSAYYRYTSSILSVYYHIICILSVYYQYTISILARCTSILSAHYQHTSNIQASL